MLPSTPNRRECDLRRQNRAVDRQYQTHPKSPANRQTCTNEGMFLSTGTLPSAMPTTSNAPRSPRRREWVSIPAESYATLSHPKNLAGFLEFLASLPLAPRVGVER